MPKSFDFYFDFAGPNGYLAHKVLPQFCERAGAMARYVPVLLGGLMQATGNQPPMIRYAETPLKLAYERLEFDRFVKAHKLSAFKFNPYFPINSLVLMRGCIAAQRLDVFDRYVDVVMSAMWENEKDMGNSETVLETLNAAGLDAARIMAMTGEPDIKAELIANTENAVARGAFGIPTFFVGDEMFWGKERLAQLESALTG